jgi:membrane protease YdiL (CAAX protease family)
LVFGREPAKDGPDFMPTEPAQLAIALFELCLFLTGTVLAARVLFTSAARTRWLRTNALPSAPMNVLDFALGALLIPATGLAFQAVAQVWLSPIIAQGTDKQGIALFAYGVSNYIGAFVAWQWLLPSLSRSLAFEPPPPPATPTPTLPWPRALRYAAGAFMVALPVISAVSLPWTYVVKQFGLPPEAQDAIAMFANTRSPLVIAGMLLVACVLAPVYEELLFRKGLYRFCRQRLGRGWALVISGLCFGALHQNWAGFLPLAALGMGLAIVYEATGSIRVPIIVHGLFNLNTVLILLSGLQEVAK